MFANLAPIDIAIITLPLGIVLFVSIYLRRYMRSVADFLAANRCAGRYLISTAGAETGASVMSMIVGLELFSRVGWSLGFWGGITNFLFFFMGLLGLVSYRFRQTRALTFHQFFEVRYSKGSRIYASFLHAFSGCLSFGVQPAVGSRFFVYFCGLPESLHIAGVNLPMFIPVMLVLMSMSLYFALTGGQISVMVTDCLEGVISSVFYLIIAGFLICAFSISQFKTAMLSGAPGASYVDPFDIGAQPDFNGWYVLIGVLISLYWFRGGAWNQGFAAAAKTPHEGRMAGILGNWRGYNNAAMTALVSLGAFTLLHNPLYASQKLQVAHTLAGISLPQLRTQMQMPVALGLLLIPGIKGCFCAVLLFGLLAGQGQQLHSYGSTFLQDVFLPLCKAPLSPRAHVLYLRLMVFGVALFACFFSIWFKPMDYLVLAVQLLSTLYLGGIGLVVWGGLYWKKGTSAGAWTSMLTGSGLSVIFFTFQQKWTAIQPWLITRIGNHTSTWRYLTAHTDKCPLNGQQLTLITVVLSALGYLLISLLTSKSDFDLDALLHREEHNARPPEPRDRPLLARLLNIDENFTRGDRILTYSTFTFTLILQGIAVLIAAWALFVHRLSPNWWFNYMLITTVGVALVVAVPTTIWFTIGVAGDLRELLVTLKSAKRNDTDDGTEHAPDSHSG